jgi:hypothetical protein
MALQLYQQLLAAHSNDADKNTFVALDIDRISWVYQQAIFPAKEIVYRKTLETITSKYESVPASSQAWYLLARLESNAAAGYQPFEDTTNRYGYVKAKQLAEKGIKLFKEENTGTINLQTLLYEIKKRQLSTQTESVNVPDKPFRALISYRNIDTVFVRVIKMADHEGAYNNQGDNKFWQSMAAMPQVKSFVQALPVVTDHQTHHTEIKIDGLPEGVYALLSSDNRRFNDSLDKLSMQFFHVSNISYVQSNNEFFVVRRDNGKPISNVKVTIQKTGYDNKSSKIVYEKIAEKTSDKNGFFSYSDPKNYYNLNFVFTKDKDRLDMREGQAVYNYDYEGVADTDEFEKNNRRIFFFVDRGIYRPGQIVYFKGIAVTRERKTKTSKSYTDKKPVWVYLHDANGKKYDSLSLVLNDYGSFNGKFQIPQNVLTGRFSVMVKGFHAVVPEFNVEEYKRPTFNVTFEKVKGAYRLNDSVTVTGNVNAFAGSYINGAKVVYNVRRNARYNPFWSFRRPSPGVDSREITHGEAVTDASGKFTIRFKADADDILDKSGNPVFDFSVSADVTDISGETRSNSTIVSAGYSSLLLQITGETIFDSDSLKQINIQSTNLSYEKEPAVVTVKMYALRAPEKAVRKRYWQRPDQFVMSRQEFSNFFPTDEYENESDEHTWATGPLVKEATIDTKDSLPIIPGSLLPGYYRIEAGGKDKYGAEVKTTKYIEVFSSRKQQMAAPKIQFNYAIAPIAKPGEQASFISASAADELFVIRRTDKSDKKSVYTFLNKNDKFEKLTYTPNETDRGGVIISEAYVYDNRVYTHLYNINVPWNNKQLQVAYASYRDKTEPGSKETWTVTVQNDKNEKAAAELMTAMYDASLDQFKSNSWAVPDVWLESIAQRLFTGYTNFNSQQSTENYLPEKFYGEINPTFDQLATDASELWSKNINRWINDSTMYVSVSLKRSLDMLKEVVVVGYGTQKKTNISANLKIRGMSSMNVEGQRDMSLQGNIAGLKVTPPMAAADEAVSKEEADKNETATIVTRKNFNETAFFFPQLYTDSSGAYQFTFTMPESLTQWKWMSLAHTKDLAFGTNSAYIITQKKMMVQANAPRFMREGDNMEFSGKIINMGEKEITGQVTLELVDPVTNTSIDGWFQNVFPVQYFTVEAGQSFAVKFPIQIPFSYNRPLTWRIKAKAGEFSDGEENTLPILTNRMLVTESLPVFLPNDTTLHFTLEKLARNTSESLTHEAVTVEYTSNPIWHAVQALPYLMEYPYECAEQTFNRFYANAMASYIVSKYPGIKTVFDLWKADSASFKSNLQKNSELKQILLQETPWVLQAESEEQRRKNLALLFDLVKISTETNASFQKLSQMQLPNGSFSWFKGGNEDRYMTNYILTGIGKLKRLGAISSDMTIRMRPMVMNALKYADNKIAQDYKWINDQKTDVNIQGISTIQIEYLFMRSFFRDITPLHQKEYDYYFKQGKLFWQKQNSYYKAQLGLIYYRNSEEKFATATILPSLLENTVIDSKQGMYWKTAYTGWWYQSPIEHQSMMIAFMSEINLDQKDAAIIKNIDAMKTWLLLNKQTNNWRTTVATADACYALLLNGSDWLSAEKSVTIQLGKTIISSNNQKAEAATGYIKKRIDGKLVTPDMGNITITVNSSQPRSTTQSTNSNIVTSPGWGNIYWQYFEDLDKITPAKTPLSLTKKLFVQRNTDKGVVLDPVKENEELKTGDKIIVRIELRSDRDMDYLHLKDMRASSMEPVNVLSGYKWQNGLGYYESTKDASTNFFIDHLRKGTYVFDYPLFITHTGVFSVGIASIQCMYAPEFTSHSAGIKIRVAR